MKELIKKLEDCTKKGEVEYFNGENFVAYETFLKCEELALKIDDPQWVAESTKNVGRILHRMGKYEEAKKKYLKALNILNEHRQISEKPRYLNHLANVYHYTNEFDKQCECLREALKISEEIGDDYSKAKIYNSIGVYHEIFGKYEKALIYMEKALDYFKTHKSDYAIGISYNLISSVKTKLEDFSGALDYVKKAYSVAKNNNDIHSTAFSLRNFIRIYYNQEKYEDCLGYFDELLPLKDKIENKKMNCDILRIVGLVYQKFNRDEKASTTLKDALKIAREITYFHGIAKSNEFLGDLFFKNKQYLESYRYYSNSLRTFQLILNSIKDPILKEDYKRLFEGLPEIIKKVDSILEKRSHDLPSKELEDFSKEAKNLCIQVQRQDLDENISKDCSDNVKKLYETKHLDFEIREKIRDEWCNTLSKACFMKLDEETQDYLIRYKLNVLRIPDDYKSIISKISIAVECEIRTKLFDGFRSYWNNKMKTKLRTIRDNTLDKKFIFTYYKLRSYLEEDKFLELGPLYYILSTVLKRYSFKRIPKEYTKPFEKFREYIGVKNLMFLNRITKFFDKKYKCGTNRHSFINIRNSCTHGGGRVQEKRKKMEINIGKDTFEEIENNLINQDVNLLRTFCSLEF